MLALPPLLLLIARPVAAQAPLFLVDEETVVRDIAFRFDSTQTFEEDELKAQIAAAEPGFIDRVKRVLPLLEPAPYPFSPLELQRDVARLRQFYHENGFLRARIDYAPSRLDTARNAIRIVFAVDEGPPVVVRSLEFFGPEERVFPGTEQETWRPPFQRSVTVREGDRYTLFERLRTRDQLLTWMKNHGHAFAQVRDTVYIDSTALAADLRFTVDPGPMAYFGDIDVEGHESVGRNVIVRELPFRPGQRFSNGKLAQGQRELFALNLFRTALTELPEQPRDSSVHVLVRVREARPQLITYQGGYSRERGVALEGDWTHRNFLGGARTLTTSLAFDTGFRAAPAGGRRPARLFHAAVALRQPYLLTTRLSGTVAPFVQYEYDPQLEESGALLSFNTREFGQHATLLYEVLPFRTVSLRYTFSRVLLFTDVNPDSVAVRTRDPFNRSILTLTAMLGRSDDYINPSRGFIVRPVAEMAGRVFGSGVQYYKLGSEVSGYLPLTRRISLASRTFAGRIWPQGESRDQERNENRFDPIRFYGGGGNDLRGWGYQLAGPKRARRDVIRGDTLYSYEPIGGLAKLAAEVELRLPFPGLGRDWGTAVFFGGSRLSEGDFGLDDFRFGTGAGIRYRTPVGFVRLDLAFKLNPSPEDLRSPEDFDRLGEAADPDWRRRFAIHLSIGQGF